MKKITREIEVYTIEELKEFNKKAYDRILDKEREKVEESIDFWCEDILQELTKAFDQSYFNFKLYEDYNGVLAVITSDEYSDIFNEESLEEYQNELLKDLKNVCSQHSSLCNFFTDHKREDFDTFNKFIAEIFTCLFKDRDNEKYYYYDDKNLIEYMKLVEEEEMLYTINGVNINEL